MFKKPLGDLKTSAPLRNSDRRKLKQQVIDAYGLSAEDGETLVPDGLQTAKFSTHLDEPGVLYTSKDGDPLWFTLRRGAGQLIPTIYTLWKFPRLLPFLSTPAAVIPVLIGGADLMAPGVVQHSPNLSVNQLVSVAQYHAGAIGPPLAVGQMALGNEELQRETAKGKAVLVLHTWRDKLWELGKGRETDVPEPIAVASAPVGLANDASHEGHHNPTAGSEAEVSAQAEAGPSTSPQNKETLSDTESTKTLTPEEVSSILRNATLHAIQVTLTKLPPGSFPIAASTFYTSYLLPARSARAIAGSVTPVDIKHSTYKTLSAFLKAAEKDGLVVLKQNKGDVLVASVVATHPDVLAHRPYRTVQQEVEKQHKQEQLEKSEAARTETGAREIVVLELYKPHQSTVRFFEEIDKDTSALFTLQDIKTYLHAHIAAKGLVNASDQAYINIGADNVLVTSLGAENVEFMKRDEVLARLLQKMQPWHELRFPGKEPTLEKGTLRPINVVVKIRQGRKACTLVTGFEAFQLAADELADVLRHTCASSTTVASLPGKNAGEEVMVQGKQLDAVAKLLMQKGVPKTHIKLEGSRDKKKK